MSASNRDAQLDRYVMRAIDIHSHGIGKYDFTDIPKLNLNAINNELLIKNH